MNVADTLYGLPIVTVRSDLIDKPRFKLADNVPVTPEYRREFDAWAREFFGVDRQILRLVDPITGRERVLVSEDTLREKCREFGALFTPAEFRAALEDMAGGIL